MRYETNKIRIILAFAVGSFIGAIIESFSYLTTLINVNGMDHFYIFWYDKSLSVFTISYIIWLGSLITFGAPVWYFLHRKNWRKFHFSIIAGAIVPFIVVFVFQTGFLSGKSSRNFSYYGEGGKQWDAGSLTPYGWEIAFQTSLGYALVGSVIGLIIWKIAYRERKGE